jgi:hypothetical protein
VGGTKKRESGDVVHQSSFLLPTATVTLRLLLLLDAVAPSLLRLIISRRLTCGYSIGRTVRLRITADAPDEEDVFRRFDW